MEHITQRAIVQDHDFAKIWLDGAQIFDEGTMTESAMLAVEPRGEEFALLLKPVNDRIGVLLN